MQTFLRWLLRPILEQQARARRAEIAALAMLDRPLSAAQYVLFVETGQTL